MDKSKPNRRFLPIIITFNIFINKLDNIIQKPAVENQMNICLVSYKDRSRSIKIIVELLLSESSSPKRPEYKMVKSSNVQTRQYYGIRVTLAKLNIYYIFVN